MVHLKRFAVGAAALFVIGAATFGVTHLPLYGFYAMLAVLVAVLAYVLGSFYVGDK